MMQVRKDASKINNQNYFREYDSNSCFTWGGLVSKATQSSTQLWRFTADGNGSGIWSVEDKYSQELSSIRRSHGGAFASTPDSGFYLGGFEETKTKIDPKMPLGGYVPGYLQLNYTTPTGLPAWTNRTDTPYSPSGTLYAATAHYIPRYGSQGLIMILAGAEYNSTNQEPGNLSMEVVWFIDPVTKRWYSQKTIGQAPEPRRWACVVGAQSLNNTYDIVLFGGLANNRVGFGDVWILSLPGFVWIQADAKQIPRAEMSCVVAGRRQMITIGGVDPSLPQGTPMGDPDIFHQDIGVPDLTSLEWKDEYNSSAAGYESSNAVKSWYNEGNLASVRYDTGVEDLMSSSFSLELSGLGDGAGSDSNSTSMGNHQDNSLHPAVMGGIVGGSILAAALAVAVVFLLKTARHWA
ncbi:kelch repeat protein [Colletotrichum asianum]